MAYQMVYEKFADKYGNERFRRVLENGKKRLVAKKDIPEEELKKLYSNQMDSLDDLNIETVDEGSGQSGQSKQEPESKDCIFCGGYGNRSKFLNGKKVPLCEEDWLNHTTGEVVAQMNKVKQEA